MTNVLFAVRLEAFLRVKPFASKDKSNYRLNVIHIRAQADSGAICEATDGHRIGIRYDPDGIVNREASVRVPGKLKESRSLLPKWLVCVETRPGKAFLAVVTVMGEDAAGEPLKSTAENAIKCVDDCEMRFGDILVGSTFPDLMTVVPTVQKTDTMRSFNANYIAQFVTKKENRITIVGNDASSPHLIKTSDHLFLGVLMPIYLKSDASLPDWIAPAKLKVVK